MNDNVKHNWVNPVVPDEDDRLAYLKYKMEAGQLFRRYELLSGGNVITTYAFQEDQSVTPVDGDEGIRKRIIDCGNDDQQIIYDIVAVTQEIIDCTDPIDNLTPTDIALSNSTVANNTPIGSIVGELSTFDPNVGDTHTYSITQDLDNKFTITGNLLRTTALMVPGAHTHLVTIRTTDQGGLFFDKEFTIFVEAELEYTNDKATIFQGDSIDMDMIGPATTSIFGTSGDFSVAAWTKKSGNAFINDYSMQFNGSDERIDTPADYSNKTKLTISGWFYRDTATRIDLSQTDNSNAQRIKLIRNNTAIYLVAGPGASINVANTDTGAWQHITVVYDGTQAVAADRGKIYLDGVEQTLSGSSGTLPTNLGSIANTFKMGFDNGSNNYSEGKVDEVSVWDDALTTTEIQEIYNSAAPSNLAGHSRSADLLNWWRLGDVLSGTNMPDQAGTDDGTLINMDASNRSTALPGDGQGLVKPLVSWSDTYLQYDQADKYIFSYLTAGGRFELEASGSWGDNTYHQVVAIYDSIAQQVSLVVDGVVEDTASALLVARGAEPVRIAGDDAQTDFLDATVDEVSIYQATVAPVDIYYGGFAQDILANTSLPLPRVWLRMGDLPDDLTLPDGVGDRSGYGNHFTANNMSNSNCVNDPVLTEPVYSDTKSLPGNGIDQYGDTGVGPDLTGAGDFSLSLWYKGTTPSYIASQSHALGSYSSDWIIAGGGGLFWMRAKALGTVSLIDDGNWHHLVMAWDSTAETYEGFVDGVSIGTSAVVTGYGGVGNVALFTRGDFTSSFDNGLANEFAIYGKKLILSEVAEIYNGGITTDLEDLSTAGDLNNWWRLGDDAGDDENTVIDQMGNSDMTLNNYLPNPYSSDVPT